MANPVPKRRGPRYPELDQHKEEILFSYQVDGWSVKKITQHFNEIYQLTATQKQYEHRISAWGGRKRIKAKEWKKIDAEYKARKSQGKGETEVALNNNVYLSEEQIKKGLRRHVSWTESFFHSKGFVCSSANQPPTTIARMPSPIIEVRTPPRWETEIMPPFKKSIPSSTLDQLPIFQTAEPLAKMLQNLVLHTQRQKLQISTVRAQPYFTYLYHALYQVSNNMDLSPGVYHALLDEIDKRGYRAPFRAILSLKTTSIRAACENLYIYFCVRGDKLFAEHIEKLYPDVEIDFYAQLDWERKTTRNREIIDTIIAYIKARRPVPETAFEARVLLFACRDYLKDMTLFFELWNPSIVSIQEMEETRISWSQENSILCTDDPEALLELLQHGFRDAIGTMMVRALGFSNSTIFRILLPFSDLEFANYLRELFEREFDPNLHLWELLSLPHIIVLMENAASECAKFRAIQWELEDAERWGEDDLPKYMTVPMDVYIYFYMFVEAASAQRHLFDAFKLRHTHINPAILQGQAESFSIGRTGRLGIYFAIPFMYGSEPYRNEPDALSAFKLLLDLGVDPENTYIWQYQLWHDRKDLDDSVLKTNILEVIDVLIDAGVSINSVVGLEYSSELNPGPPIYISLGFSHPYFAVHLLRRGAYVSFSSPAAAFCSEDKVYHPLTQEFLSALANKNYNVIEKIWGTRFSVVEDQSRDIPQKTYSDVRKLLESMHQEEAELIISVFQGLISKWGRAMFLPCLSLELSMLTTYILRQPGIRTAAMQMLKCILTEISQDDCWLGAETLIESEVSGHISTQLLPCNLVLKVYDRLSECIISCEMPSLLEELLAKESYFKTKFGINQQMDSSRVERSMSESLECFKMLANRIEDINTFLVRPHQEKYSTRLLHMAVKEGLLEVTKHLLSEGADIYATARVSNEPHEISALEYAIYAGRIDIVSLFLAVHPDCQGHALQAAKNVNRPLMLDHIRDWKPIDGGDGYTESFGLSWMSVEGRVMEID